MMENEDSVLQVELDKLDKTIEDLANISNHLVNECLDIVALLAPNNPLGQKTAQNGLALSINLSLLTGLIAFIKANVQTVPKKRVRKVVKTA